MSGENDFEELASLRPETLLALQQFMQEKTESEEKFRKLEEAAEKRHADAKAANGEDDVEPEMTMKDFGEDWQLSQFWYSNETSDKLAREVLANAVEFKKTSPEGVYRAACVSAPSAFVAYRNNIPRSERKGVVDMQLFEFDRRFGLYGEHFTFYDFNKPMDLPEELKASFDLVLADPPFLSDECWEKTAQTVKWLLKPGGKILICTGKVMTSKLKDELNCVPTKFEPAHANGLSNEFGCFSNYSSSIA